MLKETVKFTFDMTYIHIYISPAHFKSVTFTVISDRQILYSELKVSSVNAINVIILDIFSKLMIIIGNNFRNGVECDTGNL